MTFSLPHAFPIAAIEQDNYRTRTYILDGSLSATPGQFIMAWLPGFDEKPFSLVDADPITLMITAVGPFTELLHESIRVGDRLWLRGPYGVGFGAPPAGQRIILVGGGYGVAPLYWLARTHVQQADHLITFIGARVGCDLLYANRFQALATENPSRMDVVLTTEDGSVGESGLVTDALAHHLLSGTAGTTVVYACGPHGMLAAIETLCQQAGIAGQLSWEAYMRCAIGICGSCEHDRRLLCLDGPVLTTAARR